MAVKNYFYLVKTYIRLYSKNIHIILRVLTMICIILHYQFPGLTMLKAPAGFFSNTFKSS